MLAALEKQSVPNHETAPRAQDPQLASSKAKLVHARIRMASNPRNTSNHVQSITHQRHRATHSHNALHNFVQRHALDHGTVAQALHELHEIDRALRLGLNLPEEALHLARAKVRFGHQSNIPARAISVYSAVMRTMP